MTHREHRAKLLPGEVGYIFMEGAIFELDQILGQGEFYRRGRAF